MSDTNSAHTSHSSNPRRQSRHRYKTSATGSNWPGPTAEESLDYVSNTISASTVNEQCHTSTANTDPLVANALAIVGVDGWHNEVVIAAEGKYSCVDVWVPFETGRGVVCKDSAGGCQDGQKEGRYKLHVDDCSCGVRY